MRDEHPDRLDDGLHPIYDGAQTVVKAAKRKGRRGKSRYRGVGWQSGVGRWEAVVHVPNPDGGRAKRVGLGQFDRERDAAIARDRFVLGVFGKPADLNFPRAGLTAASPRELREWARRLRKRGDASRFVGVHVRQGKQSRAWRSKLHIDGRELRLGTWRTEQEAAVAYDRAVLHYLGAGAYLNFPERKGDLVPADADTLRREATRPRQSRASSRFVGVQRNRQTGRWDAGLVARGTTYRIGSFDDEAEAARERDRASLKLLGRDARLNFHPATGKEVHGRRAAELGLEPRLMRRGKYVPPRKPARPRPQTLRKGASGHYGVVCSADGKYAATVPVLDGEVKRQVRAGTWPRARDAALARDRAVLHLGLDLVLNFPERANELGPASPLELRQQARVAAKRRARGIPYVGVSRATGGLAGYVASVGHDGVTQTLGRFSTAREAALCHDRAALHYRGPDAPRNFPDLHAEPASIEELRGEYAERRKQGRDRRGVRLSKYLGVHTAPTEDRWSAVVREGDRYVRAGTWPTEREAAIARDRAVLHLKLDEPLNFSKRSRTVGPASPAELRTAARRVGRKQRRLSPFVGVSEVRRGRYKAQLRIDGISQTVGYYDTAAEAALARERALAQHRSESSVPNFPKRRVKPASLDQLRREFLVERKRRSGSSSEFFGVHHRVGRTAPIGRPWLAQYQRGGNDPLGFWETEEEAAEAHDRALLYYGGPTHWLNFPERQEELAPCDAESLRLEARLTFFKAHTSSRFRGVCWAEDRQAWLASIRHRNRTTKIGYFKSEEEAARAYDKKSIRLRGRRGWLNFDPATGEELLGKRVALADGRAGARR